MKFVNIENIENKLDEMKQSSLNYAYKFKNNIIINYSPDFNVKEIREILNTYDRVFFLNRSESAAKNISSIFGTNFFVWNILYTNKLKSVYEHDSRDKPMSLVDKEKLSKEEKTILSEKWDKHYRRTVMQNASKVHVEMMDGIYKNLLCQDGHTLVCSRQGEIVGHFYQAYTDDLIFKEKVLALYKWIDIDLADNLRSEIHYLYQEKLKNYNIKLHASIEAANDRSYKHFNKYGFNHVFTGISKLNP